MRIDPWVTVDLTLPLSLPLPCLNNDPLRRPKQISGTCVGKGSEIQLRAPLKLASRTVCKHELYSEIAWIRPCFYRNAVQRTQTELLKPRRGGGDVGTASNREPGLPVGERWFATKRVSMVRDESGGVAMLGSGPATACLAQWTCGLANNLSRQRQLQWALYCAAAQEH